MRKGEALGLHWADVHTDEQVLYALSAINNSRLVITTPKTRASKNWAALSPRVIRVLEQRATETRTHINDPSDLFTGLVFCRPDGQPLRPQTVLDRFRKRAKEAGVSRITLHDLRHLAATLTQTDPTNNRWHRPTWLRPHRDHTNHHNPLRALYSPALALTSPTASQPQGTHATTTRPPHRNTRKKAAPASLRKQPPTCENAGRDDRI
ncbi:phage integrase family site specific recombinase [Streptomyces bingchenggensis BCW-1]|uniref:Phage integrase family site specific recombinase n=1 Tax=Streptomyces bingchenggensis (strain BCW-1) TaxID=749414 RepID=D7CDF7_STRBB|nr:MULTISPECIES: tyrosine-type recombinase/integrase [Streptomyces]ADI12999.1 phage integrase family site specific recombinase [Streptomyces bingchenggensis BCW-1]